MSDSPSVSPQELSQRFAQMVMMQAQNILYLLGRLSPPGEGPPPQLAEAKMLIDQLEMLQVKTQNNLTPQETRLLENTLTQMRLAFVETTGGTSPAMMPRSTAYDDFGLPPEEEEAAAPAPEFSAMPQQAPAPAAPADAPKPEPVEDKKKFFKSYG